MTINSNPGSGDVLIKLQEEEFTLKCSLQAAMALSAADGGIIRLTNRVRDFDVGVYITIISIGLGKNKPKDVAERVYSNGMLELQVPLIHYLTNLANGGKPFEDPADEEEKKTNPLV